MSHALDRPIVPILDAATPLYANYLPDELLLEILSYVPRDKENQSVIATFCAISRYVLFLSQGSHLDFSISEGWGR